MTAVLKSKEYWTPQAKLEAGAVPAGRRGKLPGSHVLDRADLKKALTLCRSCLPKFDQMRAGYITKSNLPFVAGRCDGCQQFTPRGHLLVHHSLANLT